MTTTPTPNEIAGGYTKQVACARCSQPRWVRVDVPEPYTCQRCRQTVAGRPAVDPLRPASDAQREQLAKGRATQRRRAV